MKREARILVYKCSSQLCAASVIRDVSIDSVIIARREVFCNALIAWKLIDEVRYVHHRSSEEHPCHELDIPLIPQGEKVKLGDVFYRFLDRLVREAERMWGYRRDGGDVPTLRGYNGTSTGQE